MADILWLRRDLRLVDNPALCAAAQDGAVLPIVLLDPILASSAGPTRWQRYLRSVERLQDSTEGALVVRTGEPTAILPRLAASLGARAVHVSAEITPFGRRRDTQVRAALGDMGVDLLATGTPYAVGPGRVRTAAGTPYRVFTPFRRAWLEHGWPRPATLPARLEWVRGVDSEDIPSVTPAGLDRSGTPRDPGAEVGEAAAQRRWQRFRDEALDTYAEDRDRPALDGTSRLSEALKYGEIHPRTLLADLAGSPAWGTPGAASFVSELAWREFYADVLWHEPQSAWHDLRPLSIRYDDPGSSAQAWREGRTGFPFVDAGMRQLSQSGWMHNRVRMVTASFLVKDLHVWWPYGARHFLEHLRDGDMASNAHGWQWVAGTGTDAAPYFRVFNPVSQGLRFDPTGDYVRRWVPELAHLPGGAAHEPWRHPNGYDHGYAERIVDHDVERREALARYEAARRSG